MKKYFLFSVYFFAISILFNTKVYSQWPIDSLTGKVSISGIIEAKGIGKDKLHGILKSWAADYFKNSKYPLDIDEKEYGKLVYKGIIIAEPQKYLGVLADYGHFWVTVKFWIKDEKVKYEFTNFIHEKGMSKYAYNCGSFENLDCGTMVIMNRDKWNNMKQALIKEIKTDVENIKKRIGKDEFDF
ncbi:MAG: DUF4468 domain-containing protein [Cytophagaceae bacterium]|nr:DUF4468 domain-containing protein [Cytophagaceae bacterium]MBK9933644.1 DUF4468 domain-containing protein [Cytophagaceae bacterium]MBL0325467.1 DUF4468 domain-containing protein [Cytophagaceae bacterium]